MKALQDTITPECSSKRKGSEFNGQALGAALSLLHSFGGPAQHKHRAFLSLQQLLLELTFTVVTQIESQFEFKLICMA